ncbi:hypothetical protein EDD86DRAFT_197776 [Gorgonomyces haynaldii]|nr:hypothetical protein EDD86DRAFT_197776 [Gorgonomyces haynaldii]
MTQHLVKLDLGGKTFGPTKVSTEGCSDVDDFKVAIKNKFSPALDSYAPFQLTLFESDGKTFIYAQKPATDLKEMPWKPIVVTVEELPTASPTGSSKNQLTYKGMSMEASCRKYLDALAIAFFI